MFLLCDWVGSQTIDRVVSESRYVAVSYQISAQYPTPIGPSRASSEIPTTIPSRHAASLWHSASAFLVPPATRTPQSPAYCQEVYQAGPNCIRFSYWSSSPFPDGRYCVMGAHLQPITAWYLRASGTSDLMVFMNSGTQRHLGTYESRGLMNLGTYECPPRGRLFCRLYAGFVTDHRYSAG